MPNSTRCFAPPSRQTGQALINVMLGLSFAAAVGAVMVVPNARPSADRLAPAEYSTYLQTAIGVRDAFSRLSEADRKASFTVIAGDPVTGRWHPAAIDSTGSIYAINSNVTVGVGPLPQLSAPSYLLSVPGPGPTFMAFTTPIALDDCLSLAKALGEQRAWTAGPIEVTPVASQQFGYASIRLSEASREHSAQCVSDGDTPPDGDAPVHLLIQVSQA